MLWSKQFYYYDVPEWLEGDPLQPPPPAGRQRGRNAEWQHLNNADIISMPDKWEYPWYAAWDLAFHCVALAHVDPDFAKEQLLLLTREWYMHPNGQLPAYEWKFGDVNPPVHAWAAWRVYQMDRDAIAASGDRAFLERVFHKLMLNFTWWVNRKDAEGRNIFQGGFLGLDNIGIFDRSAPLPTGGHINQADGTAWMAMYSLNLMRIALELAVDNHVYEDIATKFFEHFLYIAEAMTNIGGAGDRAVGRGGPVLLRRAAPARRRPGAAQSALDGRADPAVCGRGARRLRLRPAAGVHPPPALVSRSPAGPGELVSRWIEASSERAHLLSLLRGHRMKRLLRACSTRPSSCRITACARCRSIMKAIRSSSSTGGSRFSVGYVPGESTSDLFGGNSNWRGPIWMPINYLLIESLRRFHRYYGDEFQVECPIGSGRYLNLDEVADELSRRLSRLFLPDANGRRPVFGDSPRHRNRPGVPRPRAVSRVFSRRHRPRRRRVAPDRLDRARRAVAGRRLRGRAGAPTRRTSPSPPSDARSSSVVARPVMRADPPR